MRSILSEDVVKKRMRSNIVDLTGHMVTFVVEILLLIFAAKGSIIGMKTDMKFLSRCLFICSYGVLGAFHIGLSPALREDFFAIMEGLTFSKKNCFIVIEILVMVKAVVGVIKLFMIIDNEIQ